MASVDWMKSTAQRAGSMKVHLDQQERLEHGHSNTDINKDLTNLNYNIGCADYAEAYRSMRQRVAEVDKLQPPKRVRKDRVVCCFLSLTCPRSITDEGRSDEYFKKAYEEMQKFFGAENVHGGFVHKDEVHQYIDKDGKEQTSCEHMHTLVSAYTAEKGINGKAFETRARLHQLNDLMDEMVYREFGIGLNRGTTPQKDSVEDMKRKQENNRLRAENKKLKTERKKLRGEIKSENGELKAVLEQKARASKVSRLGDLFGETVTFNKNMFEAVKDIGTESWERNQDTLKIKEQNAAKEVELSEMKATIPKELEAAEQEHATYRHLKRNEEQLIEQRATEIAAERVREAIYHEPTSKDARLREYLRGLTFESGKTVLDTFEEYDKQQQQQAQRQAQQARKHYNRGGWER